MDKVYIVYSCYSSAYDDPCIEFKVCKTEETAINVLEEYKESIMIQAKTLADFEENEDLEEAFSIDESTLGFECREIDGDKSWEAYVVEEGLI